MPVGGVLGAADVYRRTQPAIGILDAEQVRELIISDQDEHRSLSPAQMERRSDPAELLPEDTSGLPRPCGARGRPLGAGRNRFPGIQVRPADMPVMGGSLVRLICG